jgi:hypothetical protein
LIFPLSTFPSFQPGERDGFPKFFRGNDSLIYRVDLWL